MVLAAWPLVPPCNVRATATGQLARGYEDVVGYGLGVWIESGPTYEHEASPVGYMTLFAVLPGSDLAVAVGVNQIDASPTTWAPSCSTA